MTSSLSDTVVGNDPGGGDYIPITSPEVAERDSLLAVSGLGAISLKHHCSLVFADPRNGVGKTHRELMLLAPVSAFAAPGETDAMPCSN